MSIASGEAYDVVALLCASFALAIAPGPDNCFVLAQSAGIGTMAGLWVTFGLISGLSVHITLALLGTATLLQRFPKIMTGLSCLGAIYLLYVAAGMLYEAPMAPGKALELDAFEYYRRGIILNLSNPKVILFFIAFIPQFISPHTTHQKGWLFCLGLTFAACAFIVMSGYALLGGTLARLLQQVSLFAQILNLIAAIAITLVALWILYPLCRKSTRKQMKT